MLDDVLAEVARPRAAWMRDALCAEPAYSGLPWFPERGDDVRPCKAVCARCTVADECLDFALANGERFGIWAGVIGRKLVQARSAA